MRLIVILFFSFLVQSSSLLGQRAAKFWWFDAGVKAQYGATGLFSSTIADSEDWNYDISTGYGVGVKLGINKGTSGFTIDAMLSNGEQDYEKAAGAEFDDSVIAVKANDNVVKWQTFDLYTLYRNNRQLGYFEIGPKFSFLRNATHEDPSGVSDVVDISNSFEDNYVSAVLGFGAYFLGSDGSFSGILGLRFEYGLTQALNEFGQVDGAYLPNLAVTSNLAPLFAGVSFELNWGIGYYGKASCGGRSKFIKF